MANAVGMLPALGPPLCRLRSCYLQVKEAQARIDAAKATLASTRTRLAATRSKFSSLQQAAFSRAAARTRLGDLTDQWTVRLPLLPAPAPWCACQGLLTPPCPFCLPPPHALQNAAIRDARNHSALRWQGTGFTESKARSEGGAGLDWTGCILSPPHTVTRLSCC